MCDGIASAGRYDVPAVSGLASLATGVDDICSQRDLVDDEPAFTVFHDEVRDWGVAALERAAEGLRAETVVHICYGYGIEANNRWKETLGAEWRQYEQSFPLLQQSSIDTVSLESIHSHVPLELVELIRGKKVMLGAIDVATEQVETPDEVASVLRRALDHVDADKLIPSTNCGMAPLARGAALGKLAALSAGADIVRTELTAAVPSARCPGSADWSIAPKPGSTAKTQPSRHAGEEMTSTPTSRRGWLRRSLDLAT